MMMTTMMMMMMMYSKNNFNEKYLAMGIHKMPVPPVDPDYQCLDHQQRR